MHQMNAMVDGQAVEVMLNGDDEWRPGVVVNARKMWVELPNERAWTGGECMIADENSIAQWRVAHQRSVR